MTTTFGGAFKIGIPMVDPQGSADQTADARPPGVLSRGRGGSMLA
jgi:hypothetical protein